MEVNTNYNLLKLRPNTFPWVDGGFTILRKENIDLTYIRWTVQKTWFELESYMILWDDALSIWTPRFNMSLQICFWYMFLAGYHTAHLHTICIMSMAIGHRWWRSELWYILYPQLHCRKRCRTASLATASVGVDVMLFDSTSPTGDEQIIHFTFRWWTGYSASPSGDGHVLPSGDYDTPSWVLHWWDLRNLPFGRRFQHFWAWFYTYLFYRTFFIAC